VLDHLVGSRRHVPSGEYAFGPRVHVEDTDADRAVPEKPPATGAEVVDRHSTLLCTFLSSRSRIDGPVLDTAEIVTLVTPTREPIDDGPGFFIMRMIPVVPKGFPDYLDFFVAEPNPMNLTHRIGSVIFSYKGSVIV